LRRLVFILIILFETTIFAQENLGPGRILPDETYQVRNLQATSPEPKAGTRVGEMSPDSRQEIESITWGPDMRLSERPIHAFYSTIAESPNGYVHAITASVPSFGPYYFRSQDQGQVWDTPYPLAESSGIDAYSPHLLAKNNYVLFICYGVAAVLSTNYGDSWLPSHHVAPGGLAGPGVIGNMVFVGVAHDQRSEVYVSPDFGLSWQPNEYPILPQSFGEDLTVTNSALHTVENDTGQDNIYYNRLSFSNPIWTNDFRISDSLMSGSFFPKIISCGGNNLYVIWTDYKYSPYDWTGDLLARCSTDEGLSWLPEQQLTFNHLALNKNIVARNDSLFLVYDEIVFDGSTNTEEIFFNLSTDRGQSWGEPLRLTYADYRSIYASVAVVGNRIHVAWCDARDDTVYGNWNSLYYKRGILGGYDGIEDGDDDVAALPVLQLECYPNPFNTQVMFNITGVKGGDIKIGIYDIRGSLIKNLTSGGDAYEDKIVWDATDAHGKAVSSGIYFARILNDDKAANIKLIYMK
jgi:hypothetical protein